jgi:hypothetical protein
LSYRHPGQARKFDNRPIKQSISVLAWMLKYKLSKEGD